MRVESGSMAGQTRDWLAETCRSKLVAHLRFPDDRKEWLSEKIG